MTEAEDDGVTVISVDKEGAIGLYSKKKWKTKWAVLSGGAIFIKSKKKDPEVGSSISLKGAKIKVNDEYKKNMVLK